ncbi:MAG: hypothetical protein J5685_06540 [Clostridiales bacterium]|nr:hypothetical protein [Clostridiales bacterium]
MKGSSGIKRPETDKNDPLQAASGLFGCIGRTTWRFVRNIPNRIINLVKRKINDYKRKPKRTDINKVYVLVGYTTRKHIEHRYNSEKYMMIIRRGLLLIIMILLIFISIDSILPYIRVDEYKQMFGVGSAEDMTSNDPFNSVAAQGSPARP